MSFVGVYDRHPELRKSHPLGGAGAEAHRRRSQARAKLTPEEKEAAKEGRLKARETRAKEREEKALRRKEAQAHVI